MKFGNFLSKTEQRRVYTVLGVALGAGSLYLLDPWKFTPKDQIQEYEKLFNDSNYRKPGHGPTLVDLSHALAMESGVYKEWCPHIREEEVSVLRSFFEKRKHIVFVLVDGLGNSTLQMHLPEDSFLRRYNYSDVLTCNYPATTPVGLSAICFGRWPGDHGAVGWRLRCPKISGGHEIVDHPFLMTGSDGRCEISRDDFYLAKGFWKNLIPNYHFVNPFANEPEFSLEWGGESWFKFDSYQPQDGVDNVIETLKASDDPRFVCLYFDIVDKTEHKYGIKTEETRKVVEIVNNELERLSDNCEDTLIVITADHGHIDVEPTSLHQKLKDMCIYANLGLGGVGRFPYFHVKPGKVEEFRNLFLKIHGDDFILLSVNEAIKCKLFNPFGIMKSEVRERIGTFVGIAKSKRTFQLDERIAKNPQSAKAGGHGSVLKEEMEIPFVICPS